MVLLSIGYTSEKCDIYERLSQLSAGFREEGINIGLVESDSGEMHFIKCMIREEDEAKYRVDEIRKNFNVYVANLLYQTIVDNFEIDTINKIIKTNYYYLKNDEVEDISRKCTDILNGNSVPSNGDYLFYINRKNAIVNKVFEYINENTDIILEGFFRFRLKEFSSDLDDVVDRVVEEYLIEREYNEFIKLLRYFVDIQESSVDVVNIIINSDGSYCMYDDKGAEITVEFLKELTGEGLNDEKNADDFLVSSLITIAPRFIVMHNVSNIRNRELLETIKNVFSERVKTCPGCELCMHKSPVHKV